jgi:hypothetical protein
MSDLDDALVKQYANAVAAEAIEDTLEHAEYDQRLPDEEMRDAVIAEAKAIARRLRRRGVSLPDRRDGK